MADLKLNVNLVDVLVLCVFVRGFYVGWKSGLVAEFFRLVSILCSTFLVVHYYLPLAQFLLEKLFISEKICEFTAFTIAAGVVFVLFFLIREGWLMLFKSDTNSSVIHWGGAVLSLATSYFAGGLLFLALVLLNNNFWNRDLANSFSRVILSKTSVQVYQAGYTAFVKPFFPGEPVNARVLKLIGSNFDGPHP
ncbi:MAG: CvpA family protein [Candidatus Omnitrophica bacterium]|nr:CvpA family protein [Candidatus Omnitrophota bacterium]